MPAVSLQQAMQEADRRMKQGKPASAEAIYRQIVAQAPRYAPACNNLGTVLDQQDKLAEAAEWYRRATELKSDYALAHANLGSACRRLGQFEEATQALRRAIAINPRHARSHYELGLVFREQQRWTDAADELEHTIHLQSDHAPAHISLAIAYRRLGRLQESVEVCRHAIALKPDSADAHNALGNALHAQYKLEEAAAAFRRAIELRPTSVTAYPNLANALCLLEQYDQAIDLYRKAIQLKPGMAELHNNLANAMKDQGLLDQAIAEYRKAVELEPTFSGAHSNLLHTLNYHPACDARSLFAEHLQWAARHAPASQAIVHDQRPRKLDRPLRIGYVSPDFRRHSVAYFIESALAFHDHTRFHITCYSDVLRPDNVTQRLRPLADTWRETVGLSDEQFCRLVREDRIDLLIDLTGHTANNRLPAFARKPAPIQATYLGYPTTTGLTAIDYRITDAHVDPPGMTDPYHTEKLARLPHCFLCYRPPADAPEIAAKPAAHPLTFASFNNFAKVTPEVIAVWADILRAIPDSRLLLKSNGLGSRLAQDRVRGLFERHGVAPARIDLRGRDPVFISHLDLYNQVDVALDTFPYNGTTTTCEALWMGVPVVGLAGANSVSRVGVSLLSAVGLAELIANDIDNYARTALELARDAGRRRQLRSTLRDRMRSSPLTHAQAFTRALEDVYRAMWL